MIIPLTQGLDVSVSPEDYEKLIKYSWWVSKSKGCGRKEGRPYARCTITSETGKRNVLMHRMIMGVCDPKLHVDHINFDTLDNRRENLRILTAKEHAKHRRNKKAENK
jgi:hypothetical protein